MSWKHVASNRHAHHVSEWGHHVFSVGAQLWQAWIRKEENLVVGLHVMKVLGMQDMHSATTERTWWWLVLGTVHSDWTSSMCRHVWKKAKVRKSRHCYQGKVTYRSKIPNAERSSWPSSDIPKALCPFHLLGTLCSCFIHSLHLLWKLLDAFLEKPSILTRYHQFPHSHLDPLLPPRSSERPMWFFCPHLILTTLCEIVEAEWICWGHRLLSQFHGRVRFWTHMSEIIDTLTSTCQWLLNTADSEIILYHCICLTPVNWVITN